MSRITVSSEKYSVNSKQCSASSVRYSIVAAVVLLLAALLGACTAAGSDREPAQNRFTGFLESDEVILAPEIGGRILKLTVTEGDALRAGQIVARLDDSLIRLQLAQADADVAEAEARLAQLQAAVRPEDIALAEARLAQAQTALSVAQTAMDDAITLRDNPQELDVQIAQAQAALAEARAHATAAQHQAQAADLEAQMWGEIVQELARGKTVTLPDGTIITVNAPPEQRQQANVQWNQASHQAWVAWQQAKQAKAAAQQALVTLNDLKKQRDDRQDAEAQVVAATNARDQAQAGVDQAQAALNAVKAGPSEEQIVAAEAAVQQARAARDAKAIALTKTVIISPVDGIVNARYFSANEIIGPGQRLMAINQPQNMTITIYVPAGMISAIAVGDAYPLQVESAPGKTYQARITTISDEPEFTMRQSQNVAERAAVTYAVTLRVENPDDFLRPGLPAEIILNTR